MLILIYSLEVKTDYNEFFFFFVSRESEKLTLWWLADETGIALVLNSNDFKLFLIYFLSLGWYYHCWANHYDKKKILIVKKKFSLNFW